MAPSYPTRVQFIALANIALILIILPLCPSGVNVQNFYLFKRVLHPLSDCAILFLEVEYVLLEWV
jgi:hypothetical protein